MLAWPSASTVLQANRISKAHPFGRLAHETCHLRRCILYSAVREAVTSMHQPPRQTPLELTAVGSPPPSTKAVRCEHWAVALKQGFWVQF